MRTREGQYTIQVYVAVSSRVAILAKYNLDTIASVRLSTGTEKCHVQEQMTVHSQCFHSVL